MWRVIPGFENYEVSEEGRVRSLARLVQMKNGRNRWCEGQILAQMPIPAPITYGSTCTATAKGPRSCWSTVWCYWPSSDPVRRGRGVGQVPQRPAPQPQPQDLLHIDHR